MGEKADYVIRRARSADTAGILGCLSSAFEPYRSSYTPDAYADTVLNETTMHGRMATMTVFVAQATAGEILGTISCQALSPHEGHLRGMAVQPAYLGSGVAAGLLAAAEAELRAQKCARITLDTTQPLLRAMRFYEKNGYRRSGKVTDFFGMELFEYVKTVQT